MFAVPASPWYAVVGGGQFIALTTYRKSGVAVTTQVWFAPDGDRLYMYTLPGSGKVKRLRHTSRVTLAACTARGVVTGAAIPAAARFVTERREWRRARFAIWRRYHVAMLGIQLLNTVQQWFGRGSAQTVYIALEAPASEVPHGEAADQHP